MKTDDIIWREDLLDNLGSAAIRGKLPHALLFLGPEGSGMMAHAISIAQAIMCARPIGSRACGTCVDCKKIASVSHPDVYYTFPVIRTDNMRTSEDYLPAWKSYIQDRAYIDYVDWLEHISQGQVKRGNISKDDCDRIVQSAQMKPYEGKKKIFILWKAEFLAKEGNRLLKTLEEPPANTHFILISNNVEKVLPTILSRCQIVRFRPYSHDELLTQLSKCRPEVHADTAREAVYISDQSAFRTFSYLEEPRQPFSPLVLSMLKIAYSKRFDKKYGDWTNEMSQMSRDQMKLFFRYAIHFLEETTRVQILGTEYSAKLINEEIKAANWLAEKFDLHQLDQMINVFNKCITFVDFNVNAKILFANIITKTMRLFHVAHYRKVSI